MRIDYREPDAVSTECPVSRLNRAENLKVLAHHLFQGEYLRSCMVSPGMGGGSGPVSLYGPDLSEWPSFVVDAAELFYGEKLRVYGKLYEADNPPVRS